MKVFEKFTGRRRPTPESLSTLLQGYRNSALLYVAAKLRIPDLLADAPRASAEELARSLGVDPPALHRVLRALAALGICAERPQGRFELTPLGAELRTDAPGAACDLAVLIGEEYMPAWTRLLQTVTTGRAGFDIAFGQAPWQHRENHPELDDHFQNWLERGAALAGRAIAEAFDFTGCRSVADLGGGRGAALTAILQAHPALEGILFDHPQVIAAARPRVESAGLASRCRLVEGDLFQSVLPGADVYILKSVLHDWDDPQCLRILENCRAAMSSRAALLVVERLLPDLAADDPAIVLQDVHMLVVTGGRERTAAEFAKLVASAGFAAPKISSLPTAHTLFEVRSSV